RGRRAPPSPPGRPWYTPRRPAPRFPPPASAATRRASSPTPVGPRPAHVSGRAGPIFASGGAGPGGSGARERWAGTSPEPAGRCADGRPEGRRGRRGCVALPKTGAAGDPVGAASRPADEDVVVPGAGLEPARPRRGSEV